MWNRVKEAAKRLVQTGANYLQHRMFILSLLGMNPQQAYWVLKEKIDEMDEETMKGFSFTLTCMIGEAQAAVQQTGYRPSWGGTFEDQVAQFAAEAEAGAASSRATSQAQRYLEDLNAIAYQAKLLRD